MSEQQSPFEDLKPAEVWRHFAALTRIPRPPHQEAGAREYVKTVADTSGAKWKQDEKGNLVVQVPATDGTNSGFVAAAPSL